MDLAEQIDDFIPSVQSSHSDMDSLIMLIFVVALVVVLLLFLGRFVYQKYVSYKSAEPAEVTPSNVSKTPATKPLIEKKELDANTQQSSAAAARVSPFNRPSAVVTKDVGRSLPLSSRPRSLSQRSLSSSGVRKRISRASPGPELLQQAPKKSAVKTPDNINGVDDTIVLWINQVFKWLYSDLVIVNDVLFGFISAVNQTMAKNTDENEIILEIVRILPESTVPIISNVFCDKAAKATPSEILVTMDIETTLILQLKAFKQKAGKTEVLHYRANVRMKGHLSVIVNYATLIGEMRLEGYPDIKITIAPIGTIKTFGNEDKENQLTIIELLNMSLRDASYPVDFSMHGSCPRAYKMEPDNIYDNRSMQFPNPYDLFDMRGNGDIHSANLYNENNNQFVGMTPNRMPQQPQQQVAMNRRLLVKIVKGEGLAYANDAFVSVEMDEPPQKNQTGARQGKDPFWDEHFLFELSHSSSEILFEVYDRPEMTNGYPKFLGLGLVGIDELSVGISSCQIISLQPRPYETDAVAGAITVEFVFIEGAQIPAGKRPYKLKTALRINNDENGGLMPNNMMAFDGQQEMQMGGQFQQDQWNQQIAREKNMNHLSLSPRSTSSTRNESNSLRPINNYSSANHIVVTSTNGNSHEYLEANTNNNHLSPPKSNSNPLRPTPDRSTLNMKISMIQKEKSEEPQSASEINDIIPEAPPRGRDKKKTTIFGTLRKRLSRSRTRKEDEENIEDGRMTNGNHQPTSSSASDAVMNNSSTFSKLSLPIRSRKTSISEASAISNLSRMSSISNKTFLHENSTLVLEVIENGVTRHYLVPMSVAQKPRWRRKGTKMHIYNDHTFVAKHLPSGLICEICLMAIPYRIGKQAYECRDCLLKCHKQCHVRTSQLCPKPTIQSMELGAIPTLKDF